MVFIPYPLKMDATGQLVPVVRTKSYTPVDARVMRFLVEPNTAMPPGTILAELFDQQQKDRILALKNDITTATKDEEFKTGQAKLPGVPEEQRRQFVAEAKEAERKKESAQKELDDLQTLLDADPQHPGNFFLKAPEFTEKDKIRLHGFKGPRQWTLLTSDFKNEWTNRLAKPNEPILSLGLKEGPWEIELKIPQKHIGQILAACEKEKARLTQERRAKLMAQRGVDTIRADDPEMKIDEHDICLEVDFLLKSDPTKTYRGLLHRNRIAAEATPAKDGTCPRRSRWW